MGSDVGERTIAVEAAIPPLVEPAESLTTDEVSRYARHVIIPELGMVGQRRVRLLERNSGSQKLKMVP